MSYPPGTPDPNDPDGTRGAGDPWSTPYGAGYGQPPQYGYGLVRTTNSKATAALWTGIGSLLLTLCCGLGILGVLPIVLGVKARSEIRSAGGQQDGDGMALAGIITGTCALVLSIALIALLALLITSGQADFEGTPQTGV